MHSFVRIQYNFYMPAELGQRLGRLKQSSAYKNCIVYAITVVSNFSVLIFIVDVPALHPVSGTLPRQPLAVKLQGHTDMNKRRIIIAHRGASGYLPEHTIACKAMAHAMGPDFLEQDVALTRDNRPIVIHDIFLDTISNAAELFPEKKRKDGRYYAIDFTLEEIKKLRLHERVDLNTGKAVYPERFPINAITPFEIPTLEEEIELLGSNIYMGAGREEMYMDAAALSRNFGKTVSLMREILLEPRWDSAEFSIARTRAKNYILQSEWVGDAQSSIDLSRSIRVVFSPSKIAGTEDLKGENRNRAPNTDDRTCASQKPEIYCSSDVPQTKLESNV